MWEDNDIIVGCEACGGTLKAKADLAGTLCRCPKCGAAVQVPRAQSGDASPSYIRPPSRRRRQSSGGWLIVAVIAGGVGVLAAIVALIPSEEQPPRNAQRSSQSGRTASDSLNPEKASSTGSAMRQTTPGDASPKSYREAVENLLRKHEAGYHVERWYSPVPLEGASCFSDMFNAWMGCRLPTIAAGARQPGCRVRSRGRHRWLCP